MALRLIDVTLATNELPDDMLEPLRVRRLKKEDGRDRWHLLVFAEDVEPILAALEEPEVTVTTVETVLPAIDEARLERGPASGKDGSRAIKLRWAGEVSLSKMIEARQGARVCFSVALRTHRADSRGGRGRLVLAR